MQKLSKVLLLAATTVVFTACGKDVTEEENQNEVITTMEVHLTPAGGAEQVYKFDDPDGPGGNAPTQDTIRLTPYKSYAAKLVLLDKTKSPATIVTDDIKAEDVDHRFYYQPSATSNISVNNLDNDVNGVPLGIHSSWGTSAASTGNIRIVLRHYENGGKASNDSLNSTKSSTDVDITFPVKTQ